MHEVEERAENPANNYLTLKNYVRIDAGDPTLNAVGAEDNFSIDDDNAPAPENVPDVLMPLRMTQAEHSCEWGHSGVFHVH